MIRKSSEWILDNLDRYDFLTAAEREGIKRLIENTLAVRDSYVRSIGACTIASVYRMLNFRSRILERHERRSLIAKACKSSRAPAEEEIRASLRAVLSEENFQRVLKPGYFRRKYLLEKVKKEPLTGLTNSRRAILMLKKAGISRVQDLLKMKEEDLVKAGFSEKGARRLLVKAKHLLPY